MEFAIIISVVAIFVIALMALELVKVRSLLKSELKDVYQILNQVSVVITNQQLIIGEQQNFINALKSHSGIQIESFVEGDSTPKLDFKVDDILDKISKTGIKSLTPEELEFLSKLNNK